MIKLIALLLMCGIVSSQKSVDTYGPSSKLTRTAERAVEGAATLRSLVDAIQETPTGPSVMRLTGILNELSSAAGSIGDLFSLTEEMNSKGYSADIEAIDQRYKEIHFKFDELKFTTDGIHLDPHQAEVYDEYDNIHEATETLYAAYRRFIVNVVNQTSKEELKRVCGTHKPAGILANILTKVGSPDNKQDMDFLDVVRLGSVHDFRIMKRVFQQIMKDLGRAGMLVQVCLGLTKKNNTKERIGHAEIFRADASAVTTRLQNEVSKLKITAHKQRAKVDIDERIKNFTDRPMTKVASELKQFLTKKYSWLFWNVFVYESESQYCRDENNIYTSFLTCRHAGVVNQKDMAEKKMSFSMGKTTVDVIWTEIEDFTTKKFWLHNYRLQLEQHLYHSGCGNGAYKKMGPNRSLDNLNYIVPYVFAGIAGGKFATEIADNAVEFEICDLYVAALLV